MVRPWKLSPHVMISALPSGIPFDPISPESRSLDSGLDRFCGVHREHHVVAGQRAQDSWARSGNWLLRKARDVRVRRSA